MLTKYELTDDDSWQRVLMSIMFFGESVQVYISPTIIRQYFLLIKERCVGKKRGRGLCIGFVGEYSDKWGIFQCIDWSSLIKKKGGI